MSTVPTTKFGAETVPKLAKSARRPSVSPAIDERHFRGLLAEGQRLLEQGGQADRRQLNFTRCCV
jgi:hypothetical protein